MTDMGKRARRRRVSCSAWVCFLILTLLAGGCGRKPDGDHLSRLAEIAEPYGLDEIDLSVREQYRGIRNGLEERLAVSPRDPLVLAEAYGSLGMWHQTYRFPELAITCYANARILNEGDPRWPYYQGHIFKIWGRMEEARDAFQHVLGLKPDDQPALTWLAELELSTNRDAAALPLLENALRLNPNNVRALLYRGRIAVNQKKYSEALPWLHKANRLQPEATKVRYALGQAYRGLGELERAREMLTSAMVGIDNEVEPDLDDPLMRALAEIRVSGRHYAVLGGLSLKRGDAAAAVEAFGKAVGAAPDKPGLRLQLGEALLVARRPADAIQVLETAVNTFPDHAPSFSKLGLVHARLGNWGEAERYFRAALARNQNYQGAHFNYAILLQRQGRCAEALPHFEKAIALEPISGKQRQQRALCLLQEEGARAAITALEKDLIIVPEDPHVMLTLARFLSGGPEGRNGQRALELARKGYGQVQSLTWAETMAMAHAQRGDFKSAVGWQRAALTAAEATGRQRRLPWVRVRLEQYQAGRPARRPWADKERAIHGIAVTAPAGTP